MLRHEITMNFNTASWKSTLETKETKTSQKIPTSMDQIGPQQMDILTKAVYVQEMFTSTEHTFIPSFYTLKHIYYSID